MILIVAYCFWATLYMPLTVIGDGIQTGAQPDTDRLDYCNLLLHGSHTSSIQTLQRVQKNAARIPLQAPRRCHAPAAAPAPLAQQRVPIRHRINYKLAVMTYKIHSTGSPA